MLDFDLKRTAYIRVVLLFISLNILCACSIAPFNNANSGRSLGEGNQQLRFSAIPLGLAYEHGVTGNTDVSVAVEQQFAPVFSLSAKYSIINQPTGSALALMAGGFYSDVYGDITAQGGFLGAAYSYRKNKAEFFLSPRYNQVYWEVADKYKGDNNSLWFYNFEDGKHDLGYGQINTGMNYWMDKSTAVNVSVYCLFASGEGSLCTPLLGITWLLGGGP